MTSIPMSGNEQSCGLLRRLGCMLYDALIVAALLFAISAVVLVARGGRPIAPGTASFQVLLVAASYLYYAWNWRLAGQTPGMRAWRVHIRAGSGRIAWWQTAVRFAVAVPAIALLGLGLIPSWSDPQRRAWHDRASCTRLVVHNP